MFIDLSSQFRVVRPQAPGFPFCYSLFIQGRELSALIDPGAGPIPLEKAGTLGADLVLLSHFHFDHLNSFSFFHRARFTAAAEEKGTYEDEFTHLYHHGYWRWPEFLDSPRPVYESQDIDGTGIRPGYHRIPLATTLHDGMNMDLGGLNLIALAAPGHSIGHYVFYFPEQAVLYGADIDLSRFGPWYANTYSSVGDFLRSLEMVRNLPFKTFVSSHRRPLNREKALAGIKEYEDILLQRTDQIYKLLEHPQTLKELGKNCVTVIRHESDYDLFWEMTMMEKHLDYLQEQGGVYREGNFYFRK